MLVLTRKTNESIVIPNSGVTITVLAMSKNRVKLGILAPPHLAIHRGEVHRRFSQTDVDRADFDFDFDFENVLDPSNH